MLKGWQGEKVKNKVKESKTMSIFSIIKKWKEMRKKWIKEKIERISRMASKKGIKFQREELYDRN